MKRQSLFFLILILFYNSVLVANNFRSRTFFFGQTVFRPTSPEMVSINRDQLIFDNEKRKSMDITVFGGRSTHSNTLAKYFTPFGRNEILVGELGSTFVKDGTVDVIANYFGILTSNLYTVGAPVDGTLNNYTFESKISFRPTQVFYGATLTYKQHLSRFNDKGFWLEIVIPVEHIRNDLHLTEKIITPGGPDGNDPKVPNGFVGNMKQAFRQPSWIYGKIDGPRSKTGIADLYLRIGYTYVKEETHHLSSFVGISAPTGNETRSEFLFEPVIGNNLHATVFSGTSAGFRIWSRCEKTVNFEFDTNGTMFFSNTQTRSFDLKDKAWSRYMWVYLDSKATTTSPGINVFTQRVNVSPSTARDLNTAFVYKDCGLQAELGYHFFSRQTEDVTLARPWIKGPAIASIIKNGDFVAGGVSRNNATIKEYLGIANDTINGEEVYKEIKESDLDLESASHPAIISHNIYGALSYNWDNCEYPKFLGAGGSYEFSSDNTAIQRWMLWVRFGISF